MRSSSIAQGALLNVMCQPGIEGEFGGEWIHVCVYTHTHTHRHTHTHTHTHIYIYIPESFCCPPEAIKTLLISYIPI